MKILFFHKKMRIGWLIILLVRRCLGVSISRGKPSIYFLLDTEYVVYFVYVVYVVYVIHVVYVYFVYVVYVVYVVYIYNCVIL